MTIAEDSDTITLTGGSSGARLTPQHVIDNSAAATKTGDRTIAITKSLKVDGFYDDSGWHYELTSGRILKKGANCDWVSGREFSGFKIGGFTASVDSLGSEVPFNEDNGGRVYWRNVRVETRTNGRADFFIGRDTSTDYDIDGLTFISDVGNLENYRLDFDVGTIRNVEFVRVNFSVGGAGVLEGLSHSGLLETGTENKVFPLENDYPFVKYKLFLSAARKRVATGFHSFSGNPKVIYFDDLDVPDFFDHTTDITVFSRPGTVIARRGVKILVRSGSDTVPAAQVYAKNDSDDTVSLNAPTSVAGIIDEMLVVYRGVKTASSSGSYAVHAATDYQDKTVRIRRADMHESEFVLNLRVNGLDMERFLAPDPAFSGSLAGAAAITGLALNKNTTTVTMTEDLTMQDIYNYLKWWLSQAAQMDTDNFVTKTGKVLDIGTWNLVIDGAVLDGTSEFASLVTSGRITTEDGGSVTGVTLTDALGSVFLINTNSPAARVFAVVRVAGVTPDVIHNVTTDADGQVEFSVPAAVAVDITA